MFTRDMERETAMSNFLPKKKHAAKVEYFCTFGRRNFPFLGEKSFTISEVFRSDSGADNRKRGRRSWLNTGFNFVQDWHTRLLRRLSVFCTFNIRWHTFWLRATLPLTEQRQEFFGTQVFFVVSLTSHFKGIQLILLFPSVPQIFPAFLKLNN